MIKYCLLKWDLNKGRLEKWLRTQQSEGEIDRLGYKDLVVGVFENIINPPLNECEQYERTFDIRGITEIDNGDYQGTLLYLIPMDTYQPNRDEYFMTCIEYGSCSCCDTLQGIQYNDDSEQEIKDFMSLCKDIVSNIIRPYNSGWRYESIYDTVDY